MFLSENNWHLIHQITYDIFSADNLRSMRKKFLENINMLIPYDKANFFLSDMNSEEHFIKDPVSIGFQGSVYDDYYASFEKFDYNNWIYATAQNEAFVLSELLSAQELRNNVFAREWLIRKNIEHVLLLSLSYNGQFMGVTSLFRMRGGENFTMKDKKILNLLKNHLSLYLYNETVKVKSRSPLYDNSFVQIAEQYCLTPREADILTMLLSGKETSEICMILHISESTFRKHSSNIYKKLGINKRSELNKMFL